MAPKVWLVTGCSTGFGADLVKVILAKGDNVIATARNSSKLNFSGTSDKNYLAVDLDVTSKQSISNAFEKARQAFPRIDVLVNNAGYGLSGEFESLSDEQIRKQMEVNFFGLLDVTREGLATMRDKQQPSGGTILQVTSIGGQIGVPSFSIYCATKWAVEGFSEAVQKELKPEWNIRLCNIEPGGFRTDWSGRSMEFPEKSHPAYDHLDAKKNASNRHMTQPGDPYKAAEVMFSVGSLPTDKVPDRVTVGTDAYSVMNNKLKQYRENIDRFEKWTNSTDVDEK